MVDKDKIRLAVRKILEAIGEDPDREGLLDTPKRVANFWAEFIDYEDPKIATTFKESGHYDQMIIVKGITVYSLCEHHLLPFKCKVNIAYIPASTDGEATVIGLSKIPRIARLHSHKLQLQERMIEEIGREISAITGSGNVAVQAVGEHSCMQMRGVRSDGHMVTTWLLGVFKDEPSAKAEFLEAIKD